MSERPKKERAERKTEIITNDYLDTPYPYCLLPLNRAHGRTTVEKISIPKRRALLTVSTWDGRDILQVRAD
ncbi:MAG: hypothetical protein J5J00_10110 [Deltaproteobacteria bacterium]|nr:hypothetical protein [Deltaproteobacteria bacterium]